MKDAVEPIINIDPDLFFIICFEISRQADIQEAKPEFGAVEMAGEVSQRKKIEPEARKPETWT